MTGKIIKYMRLKSGYRQEELAALLELKQSTISGYETGFSQPNYETIERIAEICDFEITFTDKNSGESITPENLEKM